MSNYKVYTYWLLFINELASVMEWLYVRTQRYNLYMRYWKSIYQNGLTNNETVLVMQ